MKFSVIIPAYNAAATIDRTIRSVLEQTLRPFEILVLDDGSTDDTLARLRAYEPQATIFSTANGGVSQARNFLYEKARGEIIAFLDNDDVWPPNYLETQSSILTSHPRAVASMTGYFNFREDGQLHWPELAHNWATQVELLEPLAFFRRYNRSPVLFLPSFCCIPRAVLARFGREPFLKELKGTDDFFLFNALSLQGPIAYFAHAVGAYRLTTGSISSDRQFIIKEMLKAQTLLEERTGVISSQLLATEYFSASAALRRNYARFLMGAGKSAEARAQLRVALRTPAGGPSKVKSLGLYFVTCLPKGVQPQWPASIRS